MKVYLLILFVLFKINTYSQSESLDSYNKIKQIEKSWEYYTLTDTISGKIIEHIPAQGMCGYTASASHTIILTETGKYIRILDLCNMSNIDKNQFVKIAPVQKPEFETSLPWTSEYKDKIYITKISSFDLKIKETYWGDIVN